MCPDWDGWPIEPFNSEGDKDQPLKEESTIRSKVESNVWGGQYTRAYYKDPQRREYM